MDRDFTQVLQSLLESEEGQKGLQQVMNMLNNGEPDADDSYDSLKDSSKHASSNQDNISSDIADLGIDMQSVMNLGKMLSGLKAHDKNTDFILALKPLLRPERQEKADKAVKLMKLISLLPALKESGMLDDLNLF